MVEDGSPQAALLGAERRERLLALLLRDGRLDAAGLSRDFAVSDDTIRRDLDLLARDGLLRRVHGGALLPAHGAADYPARRADPASETVKRALARATAALIRPGSVVILDGGTTTLAVAEALPRDLRATVVTTSPPVAAALADAPGIDVILIGGRLYRYAMVAVGSETVDALRAVRADLCVVGVLALHPEAGLTVLDPDEAGAKRAMIESSADVVAPVPTSKLNTVAPFLVAPAASITHLVAEAGVSDETLAAYADAGMRIVRA